MRCELRNWLLLNQRNEFSTKGTPTILQISLLQPSMVLILTVSLQAQQTCGRPRNELFSVVVHWNHEADKKGFLFSEWFSKQSTLNFMVMIWYFYSSISLFIPKPS